MVFPDTYRFNNTEIQCFTEYVSNDGNSAWSLGYWVRRSEDYHYEDGRAAIPSQVTTLITLTAVTSLLLLQCCLAKHT